MLRSGVYYLKKIIAGQHLDEEESVDLMEAFFDQRYSQVLLSAILVALKKKEETVSEITGFSRVMRQKASTFRTPPQAQILVDTCGTGGDSNNTFNISTVVSLLLSAAGFYVVKHGNKAFSSSSGSADVLQKLGFPINATINQVEECLAEHKFAFLFAPIFHQSMKNVAPIRQELGIRTVFNLLGPLSNPAKPNVQLIGVYSPKLIKTFVYVLKNLGLKTGYVVSGENGLDEVAHIGKTQVARLYPDGSIDFFSFIPEEYGFKTIPLASLQVKTVEESKQIILDILKNKAKKNFIDVTVLNLGFALSAIENNSLEKSFSKAKEIIESGIGYEQFKKIKTFFQ